MAREKRFISWRTIGIALAPLFGCAVQAACPDIPLIRYDSDPARLHAADCDLTALSHLSPGDADGYAAIGGEVRQRYEYTKNPDFGAAPQDARGVWLQRYAVHADISWAPGLRAFVELHSALESGRAGGPGRVDENRLALQNAFLEMRLDLAPDIDLHIRAGRQEMQFGSARIISVRDGPNVRRTFDGVRLSAVAAAWTVDLLAVRPRLDGRNILDDSTDDSQALWGVYAARAAAEDGSLGIDTYLLVRENERAVYDQAAAAERRHTLGMRLSGIDGRWSWDLEPMIQAGQFGRGDLRAWTLASEVQYRWPHRPWKPSVRISVNAASGDRDPKDADLETFHPLYPRGNYFSEEAILGPQNFYNAHVFVTLHPSSALQLTADFNSFWRWSTADGVYAPSGSLVRSGAGSDERWVATALSLASQWTVGRQFEVTAIYTHFSPRRFLEHTGPARGVEFIELTARYRF